MDYSTAKQSPTIKTIKNTPKTTNSNNGLLNHTALTKLNLTQSDWL